MLVPKREFGDVISRLTTNSGDVVYRFKVTNGGRREIIDVRFAASLHFGKAAIAYFEEPPLDTYSILRLYPALDGVLRLRPGWSRVVRLDMQSTRWEGVAPQLLELAGIDPDLDATVSLITLLRTTPSAYLQVSVLGYDAVSGSRKYFESKRYFEGHVQTGRFRDLAVGPKGGW